MIIVIADDLTGAIEVAGIGHSYGLSTALLTELSENLPVCDLIVLATETRSMTEAAAIVETHHLCQQIKAALPKLTEARQAAMTPLQRAQALVHPNEVLHIFKKTDTLLRGHVHMELRTLIEESRYEQVLYMPANPSRELSIRGGRYFVQGTPIDQSELKKDTGLQITTANVADAIDVRPGSRLRICDAEDQQDIQRVVKLALNNHTPTLLAGSTDLFTGFLVGLGHKPARHKQFPGLNEKGAALVVCSKTEATDLTRMPYIQRQAMTISAMPYEVFETVASLSITIKEAADRWMGRANQTQLVNGKASSFILSVPYPAPTNPESVAAVCQTVGDMAQRIVATCSPQEIVFEGGLLTMASLHKLGWTRFMVTHHLGFGLLRMHCLNAAHTHVSVKTDNAEWGNLLQ